MKKKQLEILEKINEDRKLSKEIKEKITKKVLKNFIFATIILLFFIILKVIAIYTEKQIAIVIYKILSAVLLTITLVLFEVAYKKDNDSIAITSIEMFFLSVITLLTPYILINKENTYASYFGVFFAVYYAIKNFIIYQNEKNKYLKEINDITQIVKKESKDELAQEQLEKRRKEKDIKPKRKRGRPKKVKGED